MRSFWFRAWDNLADPPQMIYFDLFDVPISDNIMVMQYTGQKDKHKKEI